MTSYRAWMETTEGPYDETRVISVFPIGRGFLITTRNFFREKNKPESFGHNETTFFASFEDAEEIAEFILAHVRAKKQIDARAVPEPEKS